MQGEPFFTFFVAYSNVFSTDRFLQMDFEGIMTSMKDLYGSLLPDEVIEKSLNIRLTTKELQVLEKDYAKSSR